MNALTDAKAKEAAAESDAQTEFGNRFEKKGKAVALANDDQEAFVKFIETNFKDGSYKDWSEGTDQKLFTGLAMVKSEGNELRLIAIASEEAVFADPTSRRALYRMYVNRVVNAAEDNDANPAQFVIPGGCFKQKFDMEAFKFQAKVWAKKLRGDGLAGVTNSALRLAFGSAAFAKTQFPRVKDEAWNIIIGMAKKMAEKHGYETGLFDHWLATREVQTADTSELELGLDKLEDVESEIESAIEESEKK